MQIASCARRGIEHCICLNSESPILPLLMKSRLFLALAICLLGSGCSMYPFGHSKNGSYFGGQGNAAAPSSFVPRSVQRQEPIL